MDDDEEEYFNPEGQLFKEDPFYEYDGWKFLGTYEGLFDLWSSRPDDNDDCNSLHIRFRTDRDYIEDMICALDEYLDEIPEAKRAAYVECKRRHYAHYHDPSVSPGCRK